MDRRYRKKGLTIIAPEVQGTEDAKILEIVEDKGLKYTITKSIQGPRLSSGIPNMMVFNTKGKLVFVGHPMSDEAEDAIKDALKEVEDDSSSSGLSQRKDVVPLRGWTNSEGKAMPQQAAVTKVEGTTIHFRFQNGKAFQYELGKLSDADQDVIKQALAPADDE